MADSAQHEVIEINDSSSEDESSLEDVKPETKPDTKPDSMKLEVPVNMLQTRRRTIDILLSKYSALHGLLLENEPFMNSEQLQKWHQNSPTRQQQHQRSETESPIGYNNDVAEYFPRHRTYQRAYPKRTYKRKKAKAKPRAPRSTGAATRKRTTTTTAPRTQSYRPTASTSKPVRVKTEQKPRMTGGFKVKTERM